MGNFHNKTDKMALSTRLALRYCLSSQNGGMRWIHSTASLPSMKSMTPQEHKMLNEQFWDKNKRLGRPTSPHLTIYKPQMTSLLSVTHRGTGIAQSVILTGFLSEQLLAIQLSPFSW